MILLPGKVGFDCLLLYICLHNIVEEWKRGLLCSKSFSSAKHRTPLVPQKTEIKSIRRGPPAPFHSYLPFWNLRLLCRQISISSSRLSLSGVCTCEASISIASPQLLPSPGAGMHCQITAAGSAKGSILGALASKVARTPADGKLCWPVHLCTAFKSE